MLITDTLSILKSYLESQAQEIIKHTKPRRGAISSPRPIFCFPIKRTQHRWWQPYWPVIWPPGTCVYSAWFPCSMWSLKLSCLSIYPDIWYTVSPQPWRFCTSAVLTPRLILKDSISSPNGFLNMVVLVRVSIAAIKCHGGGHKLGKKGYI